MSCIFLSAKPSCKFRSAFGRPSGSRTANAANAPAKLSEELVMDAVEITVAGMDPLPQLRTHQFCRRIDAGSVQPDHDFLRVRSKVGHPCVVLLSSVGTVPRGMGPVRIRLQPCQRATGASESRAAAMADSGRTADSATIAATRCWTTRLHGGGRKRLPSGRSDGWNHARACWRPGTLSAEKVRQRDTEIVASAQQHADGRQGTTRTPLAQVVRMQTDQPRKLAVAARILPAPRMNERLKPSPPVVASAHCGSPPVASMAPSCCATQRSQPLSTTPAPSGRSWPGP